MRYRALATLTFTVALGATTVLSASQASADAPRPDVSTATGRVVDPPVIVDDAAMAHIRALQKISDESGGNRAHGRPGFKASADYVKSTLDAAGFQTTLQPFTHAGAQGWNVVAEWPHGDANNVMMIGAHLDSVPQGPGMNDNGSGTAAVLENALTVAKSNLRPEKRMRFGFWGAEEVGLVGSKFYVQSLAAADKQKIKAYLNFDMAGTPNTKAWGIYQEGPDLSAGFKAFFSSKAVKTTTINPAGRSDHSSFSAAGVKVTGISSESNLSNLEPCYHAACDRAANVDPKVLGLGANAIATVFWKLAGAKTVS
ncbi:M20/M25/M40 family metallo-hydrolase [Pilimelia columellifera]|uniref:M28 family metallopeptidase n=1 Tax=Pilimelia columellifera subsp. columellifera TaxID=706583 RepID=A0ABP6AY53_9ACTN